MPKIEIKGWESFKPVFESNGYTPIDEKKKLPIAEDQIKMTYLDFIEDGKSKRDAIESTAKRCKIDVSDVEEVIKDINEDIEVNESSVNSKEKELKDLISKYKGRSYNDLIPEEKDEFDKIKSLKKELEDLKKNESKELNEGLVVIVHSDDKEETGKYLSAKGIKYSSKDDKKDVIFIIKDLGHLKPSDAKEEIETQLADKDVNANVKSMNIKESEEVNEDKTDTSKEALESWEQSLKDAKTDKEKELAKAWIQHYKKLLNILKESEEVNEGKKFKVGDTIEYLGDEKAKIKSLKDNKVKISFYDSVDSESKEIEMDKDNFEKTFKGILESTVVNEAKKKIKPFDKLKKGDVGEDYANAKVTVIDKAIGKKGYEKIKKYDNGGMMDEIFRNPTDYDYTEDELKDLEMVAVEDEDGNNAIFVYDGSGVLVLESEEVESLDEKSTLEKQIKEFYKSLTSSGKSHADALAEISDELDIDKKELEKVIKESEDLEINEATYTASNDKNQISKYKIGDKLLDTDGKELGTSYCTITRGLAYEDDTQSEFINIFKYSVLGEKIDIFISKADIKEIYNKLIK